MVTNAERPQNHPKYSPDIEMGSTILFTDEDEDGSHFQNASFIPTEEELGGIWYMDFDGSTCREGARAWVWMRPPGIHALRYSYKLYFDCTNNEAEYEE